MKCWYANHFSFMLHNIYLLCSLSAQHQIFSPTISCSVCNPPPPPPPHTHTYLHPHHPHTPQPQYPDPFPPSIHPSEKYVSALSLIIFRVTGSWWGESIGHLWITLTKASDAELWCFLWCMPIQTAEQTVQMPLIWDDMALIVTSL